MQAAPISIVVPTYNGRRHIRQAISSALAQTCLPCELLVSDSGSTDETLKIIRDETAGAGFPVRILPKRTPGMVPNWNAATTAARGEYIKFLFQDDVLEPQCLERMWNVVVQHPKVGFVWCARHVLADPDDELHPIGKWLLEHTDLDRGIIRVRAIQNGRRVLGSRRLLDECWNKIGEPTTVMIKRSVFASLGGFNLRMKQLVDMEMWLRALAVTWAAFIDEPLAGFRVHQDQMTVKNAESGEAEGDWVEMMRSLADPGIYRCLHSAARRRVREELTRANQPAPSLVFADVLYETARKSRWMRQCVAVARGS